MYWPAITVGEGRTYYPVSALSLYRYQFPFQIYHKILRIPSQNSQISAWQFRSLRRCNQNALVYFRDVPQRGLQGIWYSQPLWRGVEWGWLKK